eukprot:CAMPEP_0181292612 /NCGR_PEP_ID=MMETSP1101-20121128/2603_1 /TAXON_ID=46948 /ORGANISM="Rhodomonas abbreviata, Strain Caron Lab Isolate" /LENGTH=177 /DNA_ID=CAMNT_0023397101 /DNA_START=544 /DNA_END=1077 /DNA_ORIENTATION=-
MERLAKEYTAFPLSAVSYVYDSSNSSIAWDSKKQMACLCESSWAVGLAAGETQAAEYFGVDCSLRRCPSADNPRTTANETNCFTDYGNGTQGALGNLCHVDCANQGVCDFKTGTCHCFKGQYGMDCAQQVELPASAYSEEGIYANEEDFDPLVGSSAYISSDAAAFSAEELAMIADY